jgi:hypothetical protein
VNNLVKVQPITNEKGDLISDEDQSVKSLSESARDLFDSMYGDYN